MQFDESNVSSKRRSEGTEQFKKDSADFMTAQDNECAAIPVGMPNVLRKG